MNKLKMYILIKETVPAHMVPVKKYKKANCTDCEYSYYKKPGTIRAYLVCEKEYTDKECSMFNDYQKFEAAIEYETDYTEIYFEFELIDALNTTWCKTTDLAELTGAIVKFYLKRLNIGN